MSAGFNIRRALLPPKHLGFLGPEQLVVWGSASLRHYRTTPRAAGGGEAGVPRLLLQEALAFLRVGAGSPTRGMLLPSEWMEQKRVSCGLGEGGDASTPLPGIPPFFLCLL